MNGIIFDIQHYGIYDGPGIRTLVFFKGCPLKCLWCQNPESQLLKPQISWFGEKCLGCRKCVESCPSKAITLERKMIIRDPELCVQCGACARVCPSKATQLIGFETTPEKVVEDVIRDKPFYENSGGGVTFTGGEATVQPEFLLETINLLRGRGIHCALETCGQFDKKLIGPLCDSVDLFLFDLKHIEPELHKKFTGVSNNLILSNFKDIWSRVGAEKLLPRIPLIPGFNVDDKSLELMIEFLRGAGYSGPVHLMPYNPLARSKWEKIGRAGEYFDCGKILDPDLERISLKFLSAGFEAVCNI